MLHGFGGGGAIFIKMLPHLREYFHIICLDMLGQGASGRPVYDAFTFESALDWHMNSIKTWMDLQLADQPYYLLGHSLGGCISCHFALRHPKNIIKLILMSPVGIMEPPEQAKREVVHNRLPTALQRYGHA